MRRCCTGRDAAAEEGVVAEHGNESEEDIDDGGEADHRWTRPGAKEEEEVQTVQRSLAVDCVLCSRAMDHERSVSHTMGIRRQCDWKTLPRCLSVASEMVLPWLVVVLPGERRTKRRRTEEEVGGRITEGHSKVEVS